MSFSMDHSTQLCMHTQTYTHNKLKCNTNRRFISCSFRILFWTIGFSHVRSLDRFVIPLVRFHTHAHTHTCRWQQSLCLCAVCKWHPRTIRLDVIRTREKQCPWIWIEWLGICRNNTNNPSHPHTTSMRNSKQNKNALGVVWTFYQQINAEMNCLGHMQRSRHQCVLCCLQTHFFFASLSRSNKEFRMFFATWARAVWTNSN